MPFRGVGSRRRSCLLPGRIGRDVTNRTHYRITGNSIMVLWVLFALMTGAAIFAVLWPLRSGRAAAPSGSDLAVYRDQLDEIERDRSAGTIGGAEAEAARVEVSRRLIAAADAAAAASPGMGARTAWRHRSVAIAGLVVLPVGAAVLYLTFGSPNLPGQP